jgi:hypothetical protein
MSRKFIFGGSFASAVPLLLDLYPAEVAYSVRKLSSSATVAIRVRRSSDNTEQDIGFVGNDLDTAALLSFVGAGSGFVTKWYNQGIDGSAYDLPQTSAITQPRIVNSGVIDVKGLLPAVYFDGGDSLKITASGYLSSDPISSFSVSASNSTGTVGVIWSTSNTNQVTVFQDSRITLNRNLFVNGLFFANLSIARVDTNQRLLSSFINVSKNMSAFDNGATGGTATYTGTRSTTGIALGEQGVGITPLNGYIQEVIIFKSNQSANRASIETNINTYYGIYP